jgi:hypothetical protein
MKSTGTLPLGSLCLRRSGQLLQRGLPIIFLLTVFGWLFGNLLSSHMLFRKPDGLYSGGSTWGDLAWHLSMLSNFAQRGLSAVRENPIFPGTKLSYPFLPDLLSACLLRCGLSLQASLILPTLVAVLGAVVAIYFLARSMTGSTVAALAVPFLYFFNGSIVGCYYLWQDYRSSNSDLLSFLNGLPRNYAHVWEQNLVFSNVATDYVLPQRASVFGLLFGVFVVHFFWQYWKHLEKKHLFYAGLVLAFIPLLHFHSFVALVIIGGALFCVQMLTQPRLWKRALLDWLVFAIPVAAVALPQTLWIAPTHAGHFFRIQWGWMKGNELVWLFWLKNLSPHLPVFAIAFYFARPKLRTFYLGFVGLFLLTNIIVFQPHDYDNMKLMLWWFLVSCVLTGSFLTELWRESRQGSLLAVILAGSLMITGAVSVYWEMRVSWRMFSSEDLAIAGFVRDHTSKDAIFLTSDKHNNPIVCLAGRRVVMGYRGWLWTHGIDYQEREHNIFDIYRGSENAPSLMRRYDIHYVLIEHDKIKDYYENPPFFAAHFAAVYSSPNYIVFKVPE